MTHCPLDCAIRFTESINWTEVSAGALIGLVYVLVGASPFGAAVYLWTFTGARILHTLAYTAGLQPWRALCFFVSVACLLGMSVQVLMSVLG